MNLFFTLIWKKLTIFFPKKLGNTEHFSLANLVHWRARWALAPSGKKCIMLLSFKNVSPSGVFGINYKNPPNTCNIPCRISKIVINFLKPLKFCRQLSFYQYQYPWTLKNVQRYVDFPVKEHSTSFTNQLTIWEVLYLACENSYIMFCGRAF